MHNTDMPSADDDVPATKGDFRVILTELRSVSNELKSFATKDDLKPFATKDDLKDFPTKSEMVRDLAVVSSRIDLRMDTFERKMDAHYEQFRGQIMTWADSFASQVQGVRRGEEFLDHRVTELEKRASGPG